MTESEQRHFEVVLEQILHEVRTVAEGHGMLDEKMERFHKEAKEDHHTAMNLIKFSHDELNHKMDGVRTELKEEMAAGFKMLGDKVDGINTREGALGYKVDGHEERITLLERRAA